MVCIGSTSHSWCALIGNNSHRHYALVCINWKSLTHTHTHTIHTACSTSCYVRAVAIHKQPEMLAESLQCCIKHVDEQTRAGREREGERERGREGGREEREGEGERVRECVCMCMCVCL